MHIFVAMHLPYFTIAYIKNYIVNERVRAFERRPTINENTSGVKGHDINKTSAPYFPIR